MKGARPALRYAKAILNLAKQTRVDTEVNSNMQLIITTISGNDDLAIMLNSPVIKASDKKKVYKIMGYPHVNKNYGNFTGSWPAQAAHKALTVLARKINLKNSDDMNQIKFWIIEKKTGKKYCYIGSRIKLVRPNIIINKNGKKVKFWHKTTLRKCEFKSNKNLHP